jgi:hypothetical protein
MLLHTRRAGVTDAELYAEGSSNLWLLLFKLAAPAALVPVAAAG